MRTGRDEAVGASDEAVEWSNAVWCGEVEVFLGGHVSLHVLKSLLTTMNSFAFCGPKRPPSKLRIC